MVGMRCGTSAAGRRPARSLVVRLGVVLLAGAIVHAGAEAALPTAEVALSIEPMRKDVGHTRVDAETARRCTIDQEVFEGARSIVVRDPDGVVLRVFTDTNGDRVVDRWRFYKDGVEIYRDIDANFDTRAEQSRSFAPGEGRAEPAARSQTRRPSVRR